MNKTWCEHTKPGTTISVRKPEYVNFDYWKFCPICGTPRPQEPKKLEEILFEAFQSQFNNPMFWTDTLGSSIRKGSKLQAEAVIECVCEEIDRWNAKGPRNCILYGNLKYHLREMLR